jgi:hypothetical protein
MSIITPYAELNRPTSGHILFVNITGIPFYRWIVFSKPKKYSSGNYAEALGELYALSVNIGNFFSIIL